MKTTFSLHEVSDFLERKLQAQPNTLRALVEGYSSQTYMFENGQDSYALRIGEADAAFTSDLFAHEHFGHVLPIPKVIEIGKFNGSAFYCISEYIEGKTSNTLPDAEMIRALHSIHDNLAKTFTADISFASGYGSLNPLSGNASNTSWRDHLLSITEQGAAAYRKHAANIGVPVALVDTFFDQYCKYLPYASEVRRLLHGDPAFDNMLIRDGTVVAVIDWEEAGYGDWMCDFARLDFWWPGRYGNKADFAAKYGLDADNLDERLGLYWAVNALWTIEFADKEASEEIAGWLREHLESKVV